MTNFRRMITSLLIPAILLSLALPVQAGENTDRLVGKLINYYHHYQQDAQIDLRLILEEIEQKDPALAQTWTNILEFWSSVNTDMEFPSGVLPDGLPEDDSLCIVVMGYQLKSDGSMRSELLSRLEVTLASAKKYPNAYILCTGGGTASKDDDVTEAGQMAKWLRKKGIDSSRIIVEDDALSTIQNAILGCRLLYKRYPQIRNLAVITSDYHVYRSCLYFHTQAALDAYEAGEEPMKVVGNASCRINPGVEQDLDLQTEGIGILTGLDVADLSRPKLTRLTEIRISGAMEYALNSQPNLTVTAYYSTGYTRNVTAEATISGYDFTKPGFQTVTATYTEGSTRTTAEFDIYIVPPDAPFEIPAQTEPDVPAIPVIPTEPATTQSLPSAVWIAAVCLALLVLLLYLKAKRAKKRRRRPRPVMKLD